MAKIVKSVEGMDAPARDESEDFEKRANKYLPKLKGSEAIEPLMFVDAYDVPTKFGNATMLAFIDVEGVDGEDYNPEDYLDKDGNECDKIVMDFEDDRWVMFPMLAFFGEKKGAFAKAMLKMFTSDGDASSKREEMIGQVFKIGKSADVKSKSSEFSYNELRYKLLTEADYDIALSQKLLAEYKAIQSGFGSGGDSRDTFADDEKAMAANDAKGMPTSEEAAVALALFKDGKKVMQVVKTLVDECDMTEDDASDLTFDVKQAM